MPFRQIKDTQRIRVKCYYCNIIYFMPYDIIGNALYNHYIVKHKDKVNKEE